MLATGSLMVEVIQLFVRQAGMALLTKATPPELAYFSHASVSAFPLFFLYGVKQITYLCSNAFFFFDIANTAIPNALIINKDVNKPTFVGSPVSTLPLSLIGLF